MRIIKLSSIVLISALVFVTIHSLTPSGVVAYNPTDEEVIPGGEYIPDDNIQYPTIDDIPSEDNEDPEYSEPENEDSENIDPEQDSEDSNSEII
jgi:hypothetical protein